MWTSAMLTSTIAARTLRLNIQTLQVLEDGTRVAVARDGIYRATAGETRMKLTWPITRGSRPINLSAHGSRLLFGEYGGVVMNRLGVRIYVSEDGGEHFEPTFEFPNGDIHHVHNVVVDPYADHYWVLTGDHGRTPGIAVLSKDGRHLDWVDRGHQMVRAVSALPRPDCLIYGSDSELEPNYLIRLEKKTGRWERLLPTEGSSLYATEVAGMAVISTSVESNAVNPSRYSCLYGSHDDVSWSRIAAFQKDFWHPMLHLGLVVLPTVQSRDTARWMFSGQALTGHHDRVSLCGPPRD
jgi:hypothetical protein